MVDDDVSGKTSAIEKQPKVYRGGAENIVRITWPPYLAAGTIEIVRSLATTAGLKRLRCYLSDL